MGFHGIETQQPMTPMPSYQYRFVVLARWPERYKFLGALASVSPPVTLEDRVRQEPYYRLALFPADKRPPLPAQALCWTSIACLLWDDAPPESLDTDQQRALLDWLHWGGQLIISGPETLDGLEHSFLAPYLPATGAVARPLTAADFSALHAYWTPSARQRPSPPPPFVQPWPGLRLEKHPQARFIPGCGQLLAERRVGRGRVVLSAFHLNGRELVEWAGFDSFFNAALLRRPPRRYRVHDNNLDLRLDWADQRRLRGDPRLVCGLRYFARDTGREFAQLAADVQYGTADDGRTPDGTGVAAWNDFNAVAAAARESLRNAARIEIPDRDFVVWVIAGYLVVLVPLNWLLFRLLGRVEWAWAAAPVIAVACSLVVIRLAQLDIGFVRSHTEIDVLELHGGYPRAHLTRYTALYSSLSTRYSVRQEHDPGGLVQPFPSVAAPSQFRLLPGEELSELTLRRDQELELRGFHVSSNATGLLHSEQMIDLGGALTLAENPAGGWQIANRSRLTLGPVRAVRRSADGSREVAVLATLEPGAVVPVEFHEVAPPPAGKSPAAPAGAGVAQGELSVQRILDLAEDLAGLEPGDARLVACCGQPVAGQVVEPVAAQVRFGTVVVAHLTRGFGADPQPDLNLREDVEQKQVP
jgi:hypothetical protein